MKSDEIIRFLEIEGDSWYTEERKNEIRKLCLVSDAEQVNKDREEKLNDILND